MNVVRLLVPLVPLRRLPAMLGTAALGAVLAGAYGALHDQVSFSISPEYFTALKFPQFWWADFDLGDRAHASVVGFLGSWWIGLIAGWALVRVGFGESYSRSDLARAFTIVLGTAAACGVIGGLLGLAASRGDRSGWEHWRLCLELRDVPAFVVVAWLHQASYVGGALGLVAAVVDAHRRRSRAPMPQPLPQSA